MYRWISAYDEIFSAGIDCKDTNEGTTVQIDMPGTFGEDVSLEALPGRLDVKWKRGPRTYHRTLNLAKAVKPEHITASLDYGLLTIEIKRPEESKPVKIEVK